MENFVDQSVVTSMGNSWIVCRSKSHSGRIYYFNTCTGEAVWNLSIVEIEKAKKATKIIENSGINMDGCPEPKEPPKDNPSHNIQFNKYLDNIPNTGTTITCNNNTISDIQNQAHYAPQTFSRNQCCNHMHTLNHFSMGYAMTCLNPKDLNVPPQQHSCNIPLTMKNLHQKDIHHNTKVLSNNEPTNVQATYIPLNKNFESLKNIQDKDTNSSFETKIKDSHVYIENDNSHKNTQDLRELISRKKQIKFTNAINEPIQLFNQSRLINDKSINISRSTDTKDYPQRDMADDTSAVQDPEQDSTLIKKKILLHLKNIAKRVHKDLWYIVPDVDTFLNHNELLKSLVESDEECRIMVLENVMTDIRNTSRSDNNNAMNHARRAMSYISQSIRVGKATVAKDPAAVNNRSKSQIVDCCLKLVKENYHIIVLCNDKELHNHEKAIHLPMYTVNELKSFFGNDVKEDTQNRTYRLQNNRVMEVIIPNNEIRLENGEPSGFKINLSNYESISKAPKVNTISIWTQTEEDGSNNKTTIDVGTQVMLDNRLTTQTISTQTTQLPLKISTLDEPDTAGVVEKTEIKLNRSISSTKEEDTGKKKFKWRRKRAVFNVNNDTTKLQVKTANENQSDVLISKSVSEIDNPEKNPDSVCHTDIEKAFIENQNSFSENIVIEERDMQQASLSNENNICENIAVENASNTGVMSKALTNFDSESESCKNDHKITKVTNDDNEDENDNYFMFEVTSEVMEEHLKTRCDEWVSGFLQIMEEVLTQLLQKDSLTSSLSPPWSVHEATQCIRKKYIDNSDIVEAADLLSDILLRSSDPKGKIDINMSPNQFMKMYSYAVYLIDSLQAIIKNSEDLQIASESMAKLLNDIQNPIADNSQNDSFGDITIETDLDVSHTDTERNMPGRSFGISTVSPKRKLRSVTNSESSPKYNLRSQWKRTFQNNMEDSSPSVSEFSRLDNSESQFFTSLHLKKNDASCEDDRTSIPDNASATTSDPVWNTDENGTVNNEPSYYLATNVVKPPENAAEPKEPKIIRNFTLCADLEAKIKNKESESALRGTDKGKDDDDEEDNVDDDFMANDNLENLEETDYNSEEELEGDEAIEPSTIRNDKFKYVISMVVREIREAFLVVYAFCEESQKRLTGPDAAKDSKRVLKTAEETHIIITQLFDSLNRIHNRDAREMERLFAKFLDSEELKDLKFDENDFQQYRDLIGQCIDQATLLRDSVECIMRYAE